ncbi:rhodanese-like domain-containing protein [Occallatibacter savannae]|uniref:rhodanese-like domain-containing protein n=1 Tax=Occallatibacter savannae TaxID=1002691 RepID=UPI000D698D5F|nr:rhodanese-like domain-containing protein [Occallatibacter savannae]
MSPWIAFIVVMVLALAYLYMKRSGQVSSKEAVEYLRNGAMLIDVRSAQEFESGHILQAYNMPLDRVDVLVPTAVKDKNKVLLLHCATGVRSGLAKKKLEEIGYKNVFNLGSYDRASQIVLEK